MIRRQILVLCVRAKILRKLGGGGDGTKCSLEIWRQVSVTPCLDVMATSQSSTAKVQKGYYDLMYFAHDHACIYIEIRKGIWFTLLGFAFEN